MSVDFFLMSETEAIQIAQDGMSGFGLYYGELDCMEKLRDFLSRNQNKSLKFVCESVAGELIDDGSIVEIEWVGSGSV